MYSDDGDEAGDVPLAESSVARARKLSAMVARDRSLWCREKGRCLHGVGKALKQRAASTLAASATSDDSGRPSGVASRPMRTRFANIDHARPDLALLYTGSGERLLFRRAGSWVGLARALPPRFVYFLEAFLHRLFEAQPREKETGNCTSISTMRYNAIACLEPSTRCPYWTNLAPTLSGCAKLQY